MATKYIMRFDDVSPGMAWSKFLPLKRRLEELGIPSLLGVVPECRDATLRVEPEQPDFFDRVRSWAARGDSIAQHGTFHVYDSTDAGVLGINPRSEFAGHDYELQLERLAYGKERLSAEGVWQPWFMAPAHSFDANTLDALHELGFEAMTDGYGFYPYRLRSVLLVPQLISRPLSFGFGFETLCVHVNSLSQRGIRRLIEFVETHARYFVDFKEVAALPARDDAVAKALRIGSSLCLRTYRRLRQ